MSKSFLKKLHIYASVFFLPVMFVYLITGSIFLMGYGKNAGANVTKYSIQGPEIKDKKEFLINFAKSKNLKISDTLQKIKNGQFELYNAKYSIVLKRKGDVNNIEYIQRNWWGTLFMMHVDHGGQFFRILTYIFCIFVFITYLSGFLFTAWCKGHRKASVLSFILGTIVVIGAYISAVNL